MRKALLSVLMVLSSITTNAQTDGDVLYIYRKDGGFNAFFNNEIDSIVFAVENNGNKVTLLQEIYTDKEVCRVPLEDIDKMELIPREKVLTSCPDDNHPHAIDLGLPSGTKWACCNVGASTPDGYGGYYAWGETSEKAVYNEVTYHYASGVDNDGDGFYYDDHNGVWQDLGFDFASTSYDVANAKWGSVWRMPSLKHMQELVRNCTSQFTALEGVKGLLCTGPSGGSVFLPASGSKLSDKLDDEGFEGYYWSSTRGSRYSLYGAYVLFFSGYYDLMLGCSDRISRLYGLSVRPIFMEFEDFVLSSTSPIIIKKGEDHNIQIISGNGLYSVESSDVEVASTEINNNNVVIHVRKVGSATITVTDTKSSQSASIDVTVNGGLDPNDMSCPDDNHPHAIDLGLPSGTKWACCNLGASSPEGNGGYYAWGETSEKYVYTWENYSYYDSSTGNFKNIGSDIASTSYDVAQVIWGGDWCMPSLNQMQELVRNCTFQWKTLDGVNGMLFTGPSGSSVFLLAAGDRWDDELNIGDNKGYYWSSTQDPENSNSACQFSFQLYKGSVGAGWGYSSRYGGRIVRPVSK